MKIYFTTSLYGKEKYEENYRKVVKVLTDLGHSVISEHVFGKDVNDLVDQQDEERVSYYKQILSWVNESDLVVAEVTSPSSSLGHEVSLALEKGKPVVALSYKGIAPNIFKGITNDKFLLVEYDSLDTSLELQLKKAIKKAQKTVDIRFNFFISPEISRYLDWISKYHRIPRSVYLRDKIQEDMDNNKEYQEYLNS